MTGSMTYNNVSTPVLQCTPHVVSQSSHVPARHDKRGWGMAIIDTRTCILLTNTVYRTWSWRCARGAALAVLD